MPKDSCLLLPVSPQTRMRRLPNTPINPKLEPPPALFCLTGLLHAMDPALWDGSTSALCPSHMDWQNGLEVHSSQSAGWQTPPVLHSYQGLHLCLGQKLALAYMYVCLYVKGAGPLECCPSKDPHGTIFTTKTVRNNSSNVRDGSKTVEND